MKPYKGGGGSAKWEHVFFKARASGLHSSHMFSLLLEDDWLILNLSRAKT